MSANPYTKEMQLKQNKSPKVKKVSKNKPTSHEQSYLNWLQEQTHKCILCDTAENIEMHHVKLKSTDKKNHKRLIPLCNQHHKGKVLSPHGTPVKWRQHVPMEAQNKIADELYNIFLGESF